MKIAILHMTLGLINRGSEVTTDILAKELGRKHEVIVFQSGDAAGAPYKALRRHPLNVAPAIEPHNYVDKILFRLHQNENARETRNFTRACLSDLIEFQPDIIFATNGADQVNILKKNLPKSKIVVIGHSGIGHDDLATLKVKPDLFLAITNEAANWAKKHAHGITKISKFRNPIVTYPHKQYIVNKSLTKPILLVVGALTPHKNIPFVLRVAQKLNLSLILVGDGYESDIVSDIFSSYQAPFQWIKTLEPEELSSIYARGDVFCFVPDPQEAFGRVYIEAMAAHLPIVAIDDPVRRELIGKQGFYTKPNDEAGLIYKLNQALQSKKINYDKMLEPYKLNTVISKLMEELYEIIK